MYDIIIIGAGPSGLCAALYALRSGKKVLVLEGESFGGQITMAPIIENYPAAGKISGIDFADRLTEQVTELGGEMEFSLVKKIVPGEIKKVITDDGEYEARSVIIAAGAKHRTLGLADEESLVGKGISYCAVCDGAFYKDKTVALAGGGNSALSDALYLSDICKKVYIIHRRDTFRAEENLVSLAKSRENIEFILDATIEKISGENSLESVLICPKASENFTLSISALFIAVGMVPSNGIFSNVAEIDRDGYIKTDEDCKTGFDGIFAAGDCRAKKVRQLTTATADGTVAALAACEYLDKKLP